MKHFDPTGVVPLPAADAPDAEMLDGKLEAKTRGVPELGVIKEEIPRISRIQPSKLTRNPNLEVWFRCKLPFQRGHFQVPTLVNFQGSVSNVQLI